METKQILKTKTLCFSAINIIVAYAFSFTLSMYLNLWKKFNLNSCEYIMYIYRPTVVNPYMQYIHLFQESTNTQTLKLSCFLRLYNKEKNLL